LCLNIIHDGTKLSTCLTVDLRQVALHEIREKMKECKF
jgi:hypothetical protein